MVRPSPAHSARLRLTTKQVNGGYYKGNRTGSMGAHTQWGGYVIDYRKVRNFNCPDLTDNQLKPFVTAQAAPPARLRRINSYEDGTIVNRRAHLNGREFIEAWKVNNPSEYRQMKQDWQKYLREIGKIPKTESPTTKTSQPTSGSRQAAQVTQVGKDVYSEAREEAMAQLEESSRRSNSWLGKFRRG